MVSAPALMALFTFYQRVSEALYMSAGNPGLGMHHDGGVQANHVVAFLDDCLPPGLFDIVF
jgi:hypothetical protein